MRLFVAIGLNGDIKDAVKDLQDRSRDRRTKGHYPPEENLHITLAFIGEYSDPSEVLDAMMLGGSCPEQTIRFGVREIVERGSTGDSHGFRRTVRLALDYMRRNIAWRDLRVDHLAAAANCSRSHLEKSFRIANGTSPADALREIRLSRVCELLRRTDKPLDRIAALCGFAPLHLKKAFRKRYGMTMGEFRRVNLEGGDASSVSSCSPAREPLFTGAG